MNVIGPNRRSRDQNASSLLAGVHLPPGKEAEGCLEAGLQPLTGRHALFFSDDFRMFLNMPYKI